MNCESVFDVGEMSVATSVAAVDETSLLDVPEETVPSTRLIQWIHDSNPPAQVTSGNQQEPVTGNKSINTYTHTHTMCSANPFEVVI